MMKALVDSKPTWLPPFAKKIKDAMGKLSAGEDFVKATISGKSMSIGRAEYGRGGGRGGGVQDEGPIEEERVGVGAPCNRKRKGEE